MQIAQASMPYVEFQKVAVQDKPASEAAGRRITKDVDFAFIMQPGSKDRVERVATDWFAMLDRKVMDNAHDAYPPEWISALKHKYAAWKEGHDAPLTGTSIREWPILSPAQVENFIALRIVSIEDVANMTEEAMGRYGMGSRELREKAREWLKGKSVAEEVMAENNALKAQLAEMAARLAALENKEVTTDAPKRRGRPPRAVEMTQ